MKDIPGYEGLYAATLCGKIWSHRVKRFLKPNQSSKGYQRLTLYTKKKETKQVHRLIAAAFLGESALEVNHKNGQKDDNRICNLEYCTRRENEAHAYRTGLKERIWAGSLNPQSKLTSTQRAEIVEKFSSGQYSKKALGREYGVTDGAIRRLVTAPPKIS